ncbi:MAG: 2-amino-4-hydroxy-6-hydroxymethyldihydropteridine diphosphokinase [Phycisphaerae bacterium]|nr:2-amino-4-hydroxy-6-hydroxymethyldihydropteridine diphosphokinase [Phycisphaerae bacterium]
MTELRDNQALAYVSVGSNIEPEFHIEAGLDLLQKKVCVTAVSTFYRTEPIGRPDHPQYLNGVFEIRTDMPACDIASLVLHPIESQQGRIRTEDKYASRTLDLDLILYNDLKSSAARLRLPHPDIERVFVRDPIRELLSRPGFQHPFQSAMLAFVGARPAADVIGTPIPLEAFTRRLQARLYAPGIHDH